MPQVQMPDGTVVEMPDQIDPALGARLRAYADHEAVKANPTEGAAWRTGEDAPKGFYAVTGDDGRQTLRREMGINDAASSLMNLPGVGAAASMATGTWNTIAKAVSGLAGILAGGDADTVRGVRDTLSVEQPHSNDPILKGLGAVESGVRKIAAPVDAAVEKLPDGARTVVQGAEEAIPDVAGVLGAKVPLQAGAAAARDVVSGAAKASTSDVLGTLRAAGYKLRPSDVQALKPGEKVPGRLRESLQDPGELQKDFTLDNQATTTKLAAQDLGAGDKKALMESDYEKLREPHFKTYETVEQAVAANPSPELQSAYQSALERTNFKADAKPTTTQVIGALRRQEVKRARSDDVAANREGQLDRDAADALEDQLETQLKATGNEQLYTQYVDARRSLAKIHDYESVTRGGQVDAHKMYRLDEKNPGRLTGNAKVIADAGGYGKNVTAHSQSATGTGSFGVPENKYGMIKKGAGKLLSKLPGADVTSPGFQNRFGREAATPAERASLQDYGKRPERPAPPQEINPQQAFDLAPGFGLDAPPGVTPARIERPVASMPTEQLEALGPLMDLLPPEGATPGRIWPSTPQPGPGLDLAEVLGLTAPAGVTPSRIMPPTPKPGEQWFDPSLDLAPPPGRIGKPKKPKAGK